jgi:hypothetical protein
MTSRQRRVAKALLSLAFVVTAFAKIRPVAVGLPEQFPGAHLVMAGAAAFECVLAILLWTRLSIASYWAGAAFVSIGTWYPVLAAGPEGGCICLGPVYVGPIQRAGVGVVLFLLCSMLILSREDVDVQVSS